MTDKDAVPPEATQEVSAARPSVIGRQDEMNTLMARLIKVSEGKGGVVGIRADSGLGKSYLVAEAAARAARIKVKSTIIPCRGTLHRAFHPIAALVRPLIGVDPESRSREQAAQLDKALAALEVKDPDQTIARLLNLHMLVGTSPLEDPPTATEDHFDDTQVGASALVALPDTLAGLLKAVTKRDGPLCAIFDDLDEAHPQTIILFQKLIKTCADLPVLFIATYAPNPPEDLNQTVREDQITLSNMNEEATLELAASISGVKKVSAKAGEALWKTTAGDPLFLSLLIRQLGASVRSKAAKSEAKSDNKPEVKSDAKTEAKPDVKTEAKIDIKSEAKTDAKSDAPPADEKLPATLIQLITEQAVGLAESQRETLECAAVLSDGFRSGALSSLRGRMPAADLETELHTLIDKGWLEKVNKGRHTYFIFTNRVKRSVIYKNVPEERRATMHKNAGDYYAMVSAGNRVRIENATYHYLRSGDTKRALPVVEIAINKARTSGEREQLMALYKLGVEVASTDSALSNKQIEMAERLGDLYAASGDYAKAVETYTKYSPPVTSPAILGKLGMVTLTVDPDRAANILSRSLSVVSGGKEEDSRWTLEASLCWALSISGNNYEAIRRCRDSLGKLGDTVGFGEARTMMRAILGMILFYEGDIHEANPHLESARAGWGARGRQEGIQLINQVLISMPKQDITRGLVKMMITPMLKE